MSSRIDEFLTFAASASGRGFVLVRVLEAKGSTPRDNGAYMVVSETGTFATIGGGRVELDAIEKARAILSGGAATQMDMALGPDSGQCCGGRMLIGFEPVSASQTDRLATMIAQEAEEDPEVWVFGGGHVGRALARCLGQLPVKAHLVESRADELANIDAAVTTHLVAMPESLVAGIAPGAAVIVLTHDHGLDFLIVQAALARDDLAMVGMIGSRTKRATFESRFRKSGGDVAQLERLTCPIGTKTTDKRPAVIAVTVAAQVMAAFNGQAAPGARR